MTQPGEARYAAEEAIVSRTLHSQAKGNSKLSKLLFSSSPNRPPSSQNGNIKDAFQRGSRANPGSHTSTGNLDSPRPSKPLVPTSGNSQPSSGPRFQSICASNADPFKDEVHGKAWTSENFASLDQDLEWFAENDDDLDLDFNGPPAAAPPTKQIPEPLLPPTAPPENRNVVPSSQNSIFSWSSSPAHHMQPPPISREDSKVSDASAQSLKRKSQDDTTPKSAPKRRSLPFTSSTEFQEPEVYVPRGSHGGGANPTPVAKENKYDLSEITASAIKEQRRSHKLQRTQSGGADLGNPPPKAMDYNPPSKPNDYSLEDIRNVTSSGTKGVESIFLSTEQRQVLDLVTKKGQSVFFTGPAGTGKSVLMRAIITELKRKWAKDPERLAVTASTGLAACNIGGITLHSFSGIGLGKEDAPTLVKKIRRNPKAKGRWLKTKCLIIDEISMVDGELFDKLNQIGRTIRNNGRPWGGIQLVLTGDFFQLPPVPDRDARAVQFAFEASTWSTSIAHTIGLTQVFRQKDPTFAQMLNEMRIGKVSDESVRAFKQLSRPLQFDDGVEATELFPTRSEVERSNQRRLQALPSKAYRFDAMDTGDPKLKERLLANMMAPKFIDLKVGAQVMLIKNIDEQLCNGTIGKVKQFITEAEWATSGGGDGTTADEPIDLDRAVKKLKKFANNPETSHVGVPFPIVEFLCTDGSHRTLQCIPDEWKVELPNGEVQAKRSQIPLILAWALSIHKAQGQTLERVKVDLTRTFEKGQAYVALSRATSQQGLQVLRFEKSKVMAHPRVVQFYDRLYSAEQAVKAGPRPAAPVQKPLHSLFAVPVQSARLRKLGQLEAEMDPEDDRPCDDDVLWAENHM
ncbi:related to PIF1 protein precursor [Cephalotrichum gorgonifer]|uniref:ATP-dependent DNA helicase PIF1 n=1 Tax=Cephalotrichum gorgonifer TaxID=2041049 RepID=A0AAE8SVQ8_9PEZI|nr:related to PIF1 protein precursor [Cephalotrichum gorgonifer]